MRRDPCSAYSMCGDSRGGVVGTKERWGRIWSHGGQSSYNRGTEWMDVMFVWPRRSPQVGVSFSESNETTLHIFFILCLYITMCIFLLQVKNRPHEQGCKCANAPFSINTAKILYYENGIKDGTVYPKIPRRGQSGGGSQESCGRPARGPGCPWAGSSPGPAHC